MVITTREALATTLRLTADEFDEQREKISIATRKIDQALQLFTEAKDILVEVKDASERTHALLVENVNELGGKIRTVAGRVTALEEGQA